MTFTENLESAKNGNRRSYGMLCNEYADNLYAVAIIVLDTGSDGETAVFNAFEDGFRAIGRINDGNHLKAWLSRELTKHIVAKLKEYRAENKSVSDGNIPEKKLFCRLNDLDRLVYALNLTFDYGVKELTVITGLKEESVERKLRDSEKKLGKERDKLVAFIKNIKAPESLITKPPKVHDLTVEIDTRDDDEFISEMERIAAFAEAEENGTPIPDAPKSNAIRFMPAHEEEPTPEIKINKPKATPFIVPETEKDTFDFPTEEESELLSKDDDISADFMTDEASAMMSRENEPESAPLIAEEITPEPLTDESFTENIPLEASVDTDTYIPPVRAETEIKPNVSKTAVSEEVSAAEPEKPKELDARTFINVITAQRIKGSEFLKLMGNTRISNSAYREIEQNPNLTKEKLIKLLEESPLTSEDYVKVLTAVKQRSEMMSRKEEVNRRHEQAGLFSKNKHEPEAAPPPTPELTSNDTQSFTVNETAAKTPEPKVITAPEPAPVEKEVKPELTAVPPAVPSESDKPYNVIRNPEIDFSDDDEPDDGEETTVSSPKAKPIEEKPNEPAPEGAKREKYKGREYFIDDDVYYKGVNNGKLIFCAVCAVLLIGGSFGIRYLKTGSLLPTDTPATQQVQQVEKLPEEYLSNSDIYKAVSMLETKVTDNVCGYYKTSAEPYRETLTKDFAETDDMFFIHKDGKILIYSLNSENPSVYSELSLNAQKEFLGFNVTSDNKLYLFYSDSYDVDLTYTVTVESEETDETKEGEESETITEQKTAVITRPHVLIECYDKDGALNYSYNQDGELRSVNITESAVTLATAINTGKDAIEDVEKSCLPSYLFSKTDERTYIGYENITVSDEISYNGFTVVGKISGDEARAHAVLGGSDGYVSFDGDKCTIITPDKNKTILSRFKFIGNNLTLDSSETYLGECIGSECINETGDVITSYDSENGYTLVQKKAGEELVSIGGIGVGEKLKGVTYTDTNAYIITEGAENEDKLYSVNISGAELTAAEAEQKAVYTEKLKSFGDSLIGLTVKVDESGNREALSLNVYEYDKELKEKYSASITLDEKTDSEYLRYLSGDAEENNNRIAVDETNTLAAVSTVYFDGISEIERILCFKDDGGALNECAELLLFDVRSDYRYLTIRGNILYIITDKSVITINAENGEPVGYFTKDMEEQTEESAEEETSEDDAEIS